MNNEATPNSGPISSDLDIYTAFFVWFISKKERVFAWPDKQVNKHFERRNQVRTEVMQEKQHAPGVVEVANEDKSAELERAARAELREVLRKDLDTALLLDQLASFGKALDWILIIFAHPRWLELAHDPRKFNKDLNVRLAAIKSLMKITYGIPAHRAPRNSGRDRQIWLLKQENPGLSWGQIGNRFGMTDGAAELAYKRSDKRNRGDLMLLTQSLRHTNDLLRTQKAEVRDLVKRIVDLPSSEEKRLLGVLADLQALKCESTEVTKPSVAES